MTEFLGGEGQDNQTHSLIKIVIEIDGCVPAMPWTLIRCCKSSYHKLRRIYGCNNPADITRSTSLAIGLYTTRVALLRECLYVRFSLCIANCENNQLILQTSRVLSADPCLSFLCCRYVACTLGNTGDHNIHAGRVRRSNPFQKVQ